MPTGSLLSSWRLALISLTLSCILVILVFFDQEATIIPVKLFVSQSPNEPQLVLTEQEVKEYKKFSKDYAKTGRILVENCQPLDFANKKIDQVTDFSDSKKIECRPKSKQDPSCQPLFIGIGAMKAGTTSLFSWIEKHPNFVSKGFKELHYFDKAYYREDFTPNKTDYLEDFPIFYEEDNQFTGEISPAYLDTPPSAKWVHHFFPKIKILLCLRDPTDRAYSQYNYFHTSEDRVKQGYTKKFHKLVEEEIEAILDILTRNQNKKNEVQIKTFLELRTQVFKKLQRSRKGWGDPLDKKPTSSLYPVLKSLYYYQILDWIALFPPENILIILTDEIAQTPVLVMERVEEFLGLPKFRGWAKAVKGLAGSSNSRRDSTPDMLPSTKLLLKKFYEPMVNCLEKMIGKNVSHWNYADPHFEKVV